MLLLSEWSCHIIGLVKNVLRLLETSSVGMSQAMEETSILGSFVSLFMRK